jgi:lysophospholipase L1-like esterase
MTYAYTKQGHAGARAACFLFGIPASALVGAIVYLTVSQTGGLLVAGVMVVITFSGVFARSRGFSILIAWAMILALVGGGWYVTRTALDVYNAIRFVDGAVDTADPRALAAANHEIDAARVAAGFQVELNEEQIAAFIQNGLTDLSDNPIKSVTVEVRDGKDGGQGTVVIHGEFKSGTSDFEGVLTAHVDAGTIEVDLIDVSIGDLNLPGVGRNATEDLLANVADLNDSLVGLNAEVQSVVIGDHRLLVTGTHPFGAIITSSDLLQRLADQAALGSDAVAPEPRTPPGRVNGTSAPGDPVYVALGDSLAANVGVDAALYGYVSRVHAWLEDTDGAEYGLRNFSISRETSGTMIRGGQLRTAVAFLKSADVAYVTIDLGANDLLGHLGSADCADDIDAPDCARRINAAFASYEENMATIFDSLRDAAPDATIVFLEAYNPFALGLGEPTEFEQRTDTILQSFNEVAARLARRRGILVADGFTPMQGTAATTTHMLDPVPDIHPRAIGYDVLATAIVEALA